MKKIAVSCLSVLALSAAISGNTLAAPAAGSPQTQPLHVPNPLMPGADPHALVLGHTVWIYPTWSGGWGQRFFAFSSTNLVNWERHGPVLDFKDVSWISEDGADRHYAWAPGVLTKNGKWYFY